MENKFYDFDMLTWESKHIKTKIEELRPIFEKVKKENKQIAISFSGGKDSTAALLLSIYFEIKPIVVWFNSGYEFPETENYILKIVEKYNLQFREIKPTIDPLQKKIEVGFFDLEAINKANKDILHIWHSSNKEYDCVITGLRQQESKARRMAIGKNGMYFFNKSFESNAFYPVAKFTAKEIFSIILGLGEIPHPIYQKAQTLDERDWIRVNWYILTSAERGFYVFLKKHYPEQFRLLSISLPQIRAYV